jgi:AcrR family transcriptional regulator
MNETQECRPLGRREQNRREKLHSIEAAGRDLFTSKGFEETTTRELARTAGVGTGTLFLYFPEKRDLLLHLLHRDVMEVNVQAFDTLPTDAPLLAQLSHVFRSCYDYHERDRRLSRSFLRELFFADPEARRKHSGERFFTKKIMELLEAGQARGEVRSDIDLCRASINLMNVYVTGLLAWLVGAMPDRGALEELVANHLELCVEGLAVRKA